MKNFLPYFEGAEPAFWRDSDCLQKLLDSAPDVICSFDAEGKFLFLNKAALYLWGYAPWELLGKPYMNLVHPEDRSKTTVIAEAIMNGIEVNGFENRYLKNGGSVVCIRWSARWDEEDQVMYCVAKDATPSKELENNLASHQLVQMRLQARLVNYQRKAKLWVRKSIIEAQEKERRNLSVELHDNVNQILASCKLMLEFARENKDTAQYLIEKSYECIQQAIDEVRKISHNLNPSTIEDMGLVEAIEQLIENIHATGKLHVHFEHQLPASSLREEDKITIFRILQEQMSNILKHAGAQNVVLLLSYQEGLLNLSIQDDGRGFDVENAKKGLGLKNILRRVACHNGTCNIISAPGMGCRLEVKLRLLLFLT